MARTKLHELADLGQSIWLDYISRAMIENGQLKTMIDDGLRGMTSNPSIFNQVISTGADYDDKISKLKAAGKSTFEIYDELTVADIRDAADLFKPVYESTNKLDGYVSLEINPKLANDAAASMAEGKRLFKKVDRPNVMIKVPATPAGFPVIEKLLADGINVNVTLIFSLSQYLDTVEAFIRGIEQFSRKGGDLSQIRSVASVFVSRIDNVVDKMLDEKMSQADDAAQRSILRMLPGKAAVANSKLIFVKSREVFADDDFRVLAKKGAAIQRVLWGSTSTKNPNYKDIKYVTELIAASTVNTTPEKTLKAFLDHGDVKEALAGDDAGEAQEILSTLAEVDINIDTICLKLLDDGVVAFERAFEDLLGAIETKVQQLCTP